MKKNKTQKTLAGRTENGKHSVFHKLSWLETIMSQITVLDACLLCNMNA